MNEHLKEWKSIRERYEISLEHLKGDKRDNIRYRVECISSLIEGEQIEPEPKEMNHFK